MPRNTRSFSPTEIAKAKRKALRLTTSATRTLPSGPARCVPGLPIPLRKTILGSGPPQGGTSGRKTVTTPTSTPGASASFPMRLTSPSRTGDVDTATRTSAPFSVSEFLRLPKRGLRDAERRRSASKSGADTNSSNGSTKRQTDGALNKQSVVSMVLIPTIVATVAAFVVAYFIAPVLVRIEWQAMTIQEGSETGAPTTKTDKKPRRDATAPKDKFTVRNGLSQDTGPRIQP